MLGVGNDCDSAQASIASWVDILDHSKLGGCGTGIQTTAVRAELEGAELLSSEMGAYDGDQLLVAENFKLPAMDDVSVIDHLNQAFINEHSISVIGPVAGAASKKNSNEQFSEVKAKLANLEVVQHHFSITSLLEMHGGIQSKPGRHTTQATVQKTYLEAPP